MQRYFFIVNPISGSGRAQRQFLDVKTRLDAKGINYGFAFTEYKGHAVELAQEALAKGERCIIACGGDGTAQEVGAQLVGSETVFGLLPFGTGNDFSKALGLPTDPEKALGVLYEDNVKTVDAARANGRIFLNVAGFGFDVDVVKYTERYKKRFNGMLPYMLGIFQSLMHLRPVEVEVEWDEGSFSERALLVSACNGTHFAGGINLAPVASPWDGILDVCILKGVAIPQFLWLLPRYMKGKHLNSPHIRYFKTRRLQVRCLDPQQTLNLDGELGETTPVCFEALPGALHMLLPKDGKE